MSTAVLTLLQEQALDQFIDNAMSMPGAVSTASNESLREQFSSRFSQMSDAQASESLLRGQALGWAVRQQPSLLDVSHGNQDTYQIPILLTIEADNYADALDSAEGIAQEMDEDDTICDEGILNIEVVRNFEHDNDGQRVLYLPSER
jgi:hypothetical protein